ncbi:DUF1573 domain-containing protein [uncultured Flavobacterium sp.]|jgi:hypothetical protein|uniref:DUF1573 domain-containing protein n=1 Tax=uncultured Flavobacterium sp. TaxID=165435 RepID=UPI0011F89137|nr:DUF1573 domain-containing protein [uncultured Flavobacterium sp.]THD32741.1 MAG: DUF1573 domain-containing protein [Flavobacterium johnsoniae]
MKTLKLSFFALAGALLLSASSFAQTAAPAKAQPAAAKQAAKASGVTWTSDVHDFGDIQKGKPASFDFTFKNTTKQTVLITNVKASCGCTATNYTKTPIKPGETASITATYNAASPGPFSKSVTVTTNDTETPKILTIKGKVIEPQS